MNIYAWALRYKSQIRIRQTDDVEAVHLLPITSPGIATDAGDRSMSTSYTCQRAFDDTRDPSSPLVVANTTTLAGWADLRPVARRYSRAEVD